MTRTTALPTAVFALTIPALNSDASGAVRNPGIPYISAGNQRQAKGSSQGLSPGFRFLTSARPESKPTRLYLRVETRT
jgi:hypothetical protein